MKSSNNVYANPSMQRGFVLVGVIWFLAVMALVAGAAVLWIERSVTSIEAERQALQQDIQEQAMLARLQWLIITHRETIAGLTTPNSPKESMAGLDASVLPVGGELPLNGEEICLQNGWCFSLTDRASRLGVNTAGDALLGQLLQAMDIPIDAIPAMLSQLNRYIQNSGGLPGSAVTRLDFGNVRPLRSAMEVFLLDAWAPWENSLVEKGWQELVSVDEGALNINTADPHIIHFSWGIPLRQTRSFAVYRQTYPVNTQADLEEAFGAYTSLIHTERWSRLASSTLLIRLRPVGFSARYEYHVNFAPLDSQSAPWRLLLKRALQSHAIDTIPETLHDTPGILAAPIVAGAW